MKDIKRLANQFRNAVDAARDAGEFDKDFSFNNFPRGCCGDASDLLAQYLLDHGIRTYYVCGTYSNGHFENIQSHAWLVTDDQIIIDITGDQFRNNSEFLYYDKTIYVGTKNIFHDLFRIEDRDIHENRGLNSLGGMCQSRLNELYNKITKYILEF